jgi:L-gulonolactone oxidase
VVTEVELRCVDTYNLEKSIRIVRRDWAEANIEELLQAHRHLSFYYLGGADVEHVRMNVWDETPKPPRRSARWHRLYGELVDMLFSGYLLGMTRTVKAANVTAWLGLLFFKATMDGRKTVYPWSDGFPRKLFYRHDEIEYGVPFEDYRPCLAEVLELLRRKKFTTIIEVRFTPDRSQALLGPGVGRRTCYIELAPSLSLDPSEVFAEAEKIFWKYYGQAHLGKATWATPERLQAMFGERFAQFQAARREQDGAGKFDNPLTWQVFGPLPAGASAAAAGAVV